MLFWALKQFFRIVRQSIILSLLFALSTFIAVLIFYAFYQWYLPRPRFERSVDFELHNVVYKQSHGGERVQHELVSTVGLFDKASETLHYGQEYHISLVLDVPESDNNFDIGMFGITADIVDSDGRKSVTYKTMGTLIYKSFLLRCMTTIVYFPYYILGRFDQKQTITLTLKDNYIDNAYMPANRIILRIHDKLQYYSVNLIIEAKFSGLRYCLHRWYYTTAVLLCLSMTTVIYLAFLYSFFDVSSILFGGQNKAMSPKGSDSHFNLKAIEYDDDNSNETKFSGDLTDEDIRDLLRAQQLVSSSSDRVVGTTTRSKKIEEAMMNLESWSKKWLSSSKSGTSSFEMSKNEE